MSFGGLGRIISAGGLCAASRMEGGRLKTPREGALEGLVDPAVVSAESGCRDVSDSPAAAAAAGEHRGGWGDGRMAPQEALGSGVLLITR